MDGTAHVAYRLAMQTGSRAPSGSWLATMLVVGALSAGAQAQHAARAVDALVPNPGFADGGAGWRLSQARVVPDLGPDGGPAVLVEPTVLEEWPGVQVGVPVLPPGRRVRLGVRACGLEREQTLLLVLDAFAIDRERQAWKDAGQWHEDVRLEQGEWIEASLEVELPEATRLVVVSVGGSDGRGPYLLTDVELHAPSDMPSEVGCASVTVDELIARTASARAAVETLRARSIEAPPLARLADRSTLLRHVGRDLESPWGERLDATEPGLRQLGLFSGELSLREATLRVIGGRMAGSLVPGRGLVLLAADLPPDVLDLVLVHELTHALDSEQQASWLGDGDDDRHSDARLAMVVATEGSAVAVQLAHAGASSEADIPPLADIGVLTALGDDATPHLLKRKHAAAYELGVRFLTRGRGLRPGEVLPLADIEYALAELPRSTEQVLHPEKYWDEGLRDEPCDVPLPDLSALLGGGWALVAQETVGELQLGALTGAPLPASIDVTGRSGGRWTHAATAGWDGDTWQHYVRDDESVTVLAAVWDSEHDAREFAAAVPPAARRLLERRGRTVVLLADARSDGSVSRPGSLLEEVFRSLPE